MKKLLSVLMVLAIIFAFAGCSQKDEEAANTNESTISSQQSGEDEESTADTEETEKATEENGTTKKAETTKASNNNTTAKTTTEKETTTKRKIKLNVKFPYNNGVETAVKIEYRQAGDKKYKELVKDEKITLDKAFTKSYDIKENLIGDVDIKITLDGVELLENDFVVSGRDSEITIELICGTEMLEGGFD